MVSYLDGSCACRKFLSGASVRMQVVCHADDPLGHPCVSPRSSFFLSRSCICGSAQVRMNCGKAASLPLGSVTRPARSGATKQLFFSLKTEKSPFFSRKRLLVSLQLTSGSLLREKQPATQFSLIGTPATRNLQQKNVCCNRKTCVSAVLVTLVMQKSS